MIAQASELTSPQTQKEKLQFFLENLPKKLDQNFGGKELGALNRG
jgi:hypothetical protein